MNTAHDWFRTIASSLNDDKPNAPFRRYALKDLVAFFNDALCMIAKHKPELFTDFRTIKLSCGSQQDARDCCANIINVTMQVDVHGNEIKQLEGNRTTDTKIRSTWNKPSCLSQGRTDPVSGNPLGYVIDTVSIDASLNGRFTVSPPVPAGVDVYLQVKCLRAPCTMTEADVLAGTAQMPIDCGYLAAVRFFVLGWALSGDRHSDSAQAEAGRMFKLFFDWLGVAERQEQKYEEVA